MKKKLGPAIIIISSGFLTFLILTVSLNRFLSEDRLKAIIVSPAQEATGRKVTLGSAKVSLLSGITLTDIALKEFDSDQNFITVKNSRLRFKFLPLLQKKLVIKEFLISEPEIRIIRKVDGQFNFTGLGQKKQAKQKELVPAEDPATTEPPPLNLTLGLVNITGAVITLTDRTSVLPEVRALSDFQLTLISGKTVTDPKFKGTFNFLANGEYRGHKPVLQASCTINEKLITYKGNLTVGFDSFKVDGWVGNYLSIPEIMFNADINSINLEKIASLKQFISSNPDQASRNNSPSQNPASAPAGELTGQAQKETMAALDLSAQGRITIGKMTSGLFTAEKISSTYHAKDNRVTFEKVTAKLFGGSINGGIAVDISEEQPAFNGQFTGEGIKVSELMVALDKPAGFLSGKLTTELSFLGRGRKWSAIKKDHNAKGRFTIAEGAMLHNPWTETLAALLGLKTLRDLHFKDFSGDFTLADGMLSLGASLQSPDLSLVGQGIISKDGALSMPFTIKLAPDLSKGLSDNATFIGYLTTEQGQAALPMIATGTLREPRLALDSRGVKK